MTTTPQTKLTRTDRGYETLDGYVVFKSHGAYIRSNGLVGCCVAFRVLKDGVSLGSSPSFAGAKHIIGRDRDA